MRLSVQWPFPYSAAAPSAFFDEFADLLDNANNYTSVVMGDVKIHLDNATLSR